MIIYIVPSWYIYTTSILTSIQFNNSFHPINTIITCAKKILKRIFSKNQSTNEILKYNNKGIWVRNLMKEGGMGVIMSFTMLLKFSLVFILLVNGININIIELMEEEEIYDEDLFLVFNLDLYF